VDWESDLVAAGDHTSTRAPRDLRAGSMVEGEGFLWLRNLIRQETRWQSSVRGAEPGHGFRRLASPARLLPSRRRCQLSGSQISSSGRVLLCSAEGQFNWFCLRL